MASDSPPPPPKTAEEAWLSLAIFLGVVGIFQWSSVLYSKLTRRRRPKRDLDEESTRSSSTRSYSNGRWSLARLPLAAVNVFRVVAFRWTLEFGTYDLTVTDIVLTLGYIGFLLAWTLKGVETLGITKYNLWQWSGRAGVLAASQFPLVTALATKNNIVSVVTGIGYEKLNYLHRVTARSCFVLLLFHASGEIYVAQNVEFFPAMFDQPFVRFGLTAVTALTILVIVSCRAIRTRVYEAFFYLHFVAVFIFLLAAYFHTREVNLSFWIWPSFMFWGLDRLMRLARVVVFNHLYCGFSRRAKLQDARVERLSDDFVRVSVRRPSHFEWSPGQTAYLIMPSVSTFPLEAHPFSISSVDSALFRPTARGAVSGTATDKEAGESAGWKELVFLINVRGGFTKRLKHAAKRDESVKVWVDGPYGYAPDRGAYETSIFVAGGSGVTHTLPVFLDTIEEARKGYSQCRRVVFIWAVRDATHVQWISDALYRAHALTPSWLNVSIRIFATRGGLPIAERSVDTVQSSSPEKEDGFGEWLVPPSVRMETGRPDVGGILRGEVSTAVGSMSVTVCGSQSLTRAVRRALRFPVSGPRSVLGGGPSVTLHVESFGYA